jgi:hypothetical protein
MVKWLTLVVPKVVKELLILLVGAIIQGICAILCLLSKQKNTATEAIIIKNLLLGLDWIGLDWIGLDWIGLDWIGLDWMFS